MKFDNKRDTLKIWLQKLIATVIFTPLIFTILFGRTFKEPVLGIGRDTYLVVTILLYGSIMIWHFLRRPSYVYFSDNGNKIILRYYNVSAFNRKKHTMEIPKAQFVKFEIRKYFPGTEKIFLYQRISKGIARYPGVSLSLVKKADRDRLKRALTQYIKK